MKKSYQNILQEVLQLNPFLEFRHLRQPDRVSKKQLATLRLDGQPYLESVRKCPDTAFHSVEKCSSREIGTALFRPSCALSPSIYERTHDITDRHYLGSETSRNDDRNAFNTCRKSNGIADFLSILL